MRELGYRTWLTSRLDDKSARSYLSNARRVERAIGVDLDDVDLDESDLSNIRHALLAADVPERSASDCLSALRQYRAFRDGVGRESAAPGATVVARPRPAKRVSEVVHLPTGAEVLAAATAELGIDLVALVARCAIWAHPTTVAALRQIDAGAAWVPNCRRCRPGERRGDIVEGVRLDDNTHANGAIKLATFGHRRLLGFQACHVWAQSCYDPRHHTSIANLVLVPSPLAALTDYDHAVCAALRFRAFELYGWHPPDEPAPERPANYPAPELWRAPPPVTSNVEARLANRLSRTWV